MNAGILVKVASITLVMLGFLGSLTIRCGQRLAPRNSGEETVPSPPRLRRQHGLVIAPNTSDIDRSLLWNIAGDMPEGVRRALQQGANPNVTDGYGMSALELAEAFGNRQIIELLTAAVHNSSDKSWRLNHPLSE